MSRHFPTFYKIGQPLIASATLVVILFLPWLIVSVVYSTKIIQNPNDIETKDSAIIFGASPGSEIQKERLEAGRLFYKQKTAESLVVSNTAEAASLMREYLAKSGVYVFDIEVDDSAEVTTDTCRAEKHRYPEGREVVFLTQGYHLPRTLFQCDRIGVEAVGFPVENLGLIDRSRTPFFTKYRIRASRYIREALLTWAEILNLYPA